MKKVFLFLFLSFIVLQSRAQVVQSDSLELAKKSYFATIFSNKDKGFIVVSQENDINSYSIVFYSDSLKKEWNIKISDKDFVFDKKVVYYPYALYSDNYIYFFVINMPNVFSRDFETTKNSAVFYQISIKDGEAKKGNIKLKKDEVILNYYTSNDTLVSYYYNSESNLSSDAIKLISPETLSEAETVKIKAPENGWMINDIYKGQAYYMGVDDINPNFKFQKKLVSNTISGKGYTVFLNGKLNKEIAYEYVSDKYKPCPDYRYKDEKRTSRYTLTRYQIEAPFTNFQFDFDNNDFYVFGFLSASTYSYFYKSAFYLLKYKTSGRKIYTKVCEFDTLAAYNPKIKDYMSESHSYRTSLVVDDENIFYVINSISWFAPAAIIQMNKSAEMKKILTPKRTDFGAWDAYNIYKENTLHLFYTNVEYKEGDSELIKNANEVRSLYKNSKKTILFNAYKFKNNYIIAVFNKDKNKLIFYKYKNK